MSKTAVQKQARARRRARQKQLLEAGRKASDLVSTSEQQIAEATGRADRLEAELVETRKELGKVSRELGEVRAAKELEEAVLDGLRSELAAASDEVARLTAELAELSAKHQATAKELAIVKAADADARSLRSRLSHKSEEIEELKGKLHETLEALRAERMKQGISFDATKGAAKAGTEAAQP